MLILAGTGEKEQELKAKDNEMGIASSVRFLGNRIDVNELYQAMDIFVLPSHFEGIPLVGVEAQFAGLPCLFSQGVPKEVCFNENCRFQSLSEPTSVWVDDVLSLASDVDRSVFNKNSPYDIRVAALNLQKHYEDLLLK